MLLAELLVAEKLRVHALQGFLRVFLWLFDACFSSLGEKNECQWWCLQEARAAKRVKKCNTKRAERNPWNDATTNVRTRKRFSLHASPTEARYSSFRFRKRVYFPEITPCNRKPGKSAPLPTHLRDPAQSTLAKLPTTRRVKRRATFLLPFLCALYD